ncbi:BTAD domain-containing putative transcriptional regulator [Paenibacillus sp.]|uniref:BTAD domain-containing putative transcriptional regulator n=1 Tax=Paenibacillus sp. TaxID=58172 RepID=UPI002D73CC91|nr:BTAD domain-containing putative transcriptional regulator [Paenibacillus sp.]HZG87795.1 BTAD domain-containing putative transcriptional regulator [Paenibacillus sp.]
MNTSVVVTKLVPPIMKKHVLRRSSLAKKLNQIRNYPLTLVHAGAGYGKSTSIATFLADRAAPSCWYTASAEDRSWTAAALYFVHAVRTALPSFGQDALDLLLPEDGYVREEDLMQVCGALVNELAGLRDDLIVVVDDYHHLEPSKETETFFRYMIEHLPPRVHLVLSTRSRPDWPQLARMKLNQTLLEITERDLVLSEEELEVLFSDAYGYPLAPEAAKRIYRCTEGWVIAIQLIWQRLLSGGDVSSLLERPDLTMDDLFPYLATEVLRQQPEPMRRFLLRSSVLNALNEKACGAVLDSPDGGETLERAYEQRLFLVALGQGHYRYHALFREFLARQLALQPELQAECHRLAAEHYERSGEYAEALHHLKALQDEDRLASLLNRRGETIVAEGRLDRVVECVRPLPDATKDRYPLLWYFEGEADRHYCRYASALRHYRRVEALGEASGERIVRMLGLKGQANVYLDTIQPGKAERLLELALQLLEQEGDSDRIAAYRGALYRLIAENLLNAGRTAEAPRWAEKSAAAKDERPDELTARLHLRTGRLHSVKRMLERSKRDDGAPTSALPRSHRETELLLSLVEAFLGEAEAAKRYAQEGMLNGVHRKAPFSEAVGWMRMGHAAQLLPGYGFHVPLECYNTSLRIMEGLDVPRGKAEPLMGLCLLYGREGDWEAAEAYGRQALAETERVNDVWLSTFIRLGTAVAACCAGRAETAQPLLERCADAFAACGDSYGVALAHMWMSLTAYQEDQDERFDQAMDAFLRTVQNGEYEFLFSKRTLFGPKDVQQLAPLLFEAQRRGIHKHFVKYLLSLLGIDHMEHHPGYTLRIETLGEFRVWLGDKPVEDRDWQRGKAKELFQLLLTKRKSMLTKEEIAATLWRDGDEKAAARDFKVALNALHAALEPGRKARANPFFVQRHGSAYALNLASGFELDAVAFEQHVKIGLETKDPETAKLSLQKGLQLYKGDYLPDRRYDDWSAEERERLAVLFLRGAEKLARLLLEGGEIDAAIGWCERILEHDSCWEEAYRLLMICHYRNNNRRQAAKYYAKCVETLKAELGIEPMEATQKCYEAVLRSDGVTDL